jgi:hypothetical protein
MLFYFMSIVAINTSVFHKPGVGERIDSRKYSLTVSAVTFSIPGTMVITLLLPCVKMLS